MLTIPSLGDSPPRPSLGRPRDCRGGHAKLPGRVGKGLDEFRTLAFSTTHLRHPSREAAEPLDCVAKPRWPPFSARPGVLSPSPRKRGHFPLTRLVAAGYASPAFGPPLPLLL